MKLYEISEMSAMDHLRDAVLKSDDGLVRAGAYAEIDRRERKAQTEVKYQALLAQISVKKLKKP